MFTYENDGFQIVYLAEGLEKNKSITRLKIKYVKIEEHYNRGDEVKINRAFSQVLKSLEFKRYFEMISIYPFNVSIDYYIIENLHDSMVIEEIVDLCIDSIHKS